MSFDPPPCEELTISEPLRSATRESPPGRTQVLLPVIAKGRRSTWRGSTPSSTSVGQTDSADHRLADVVGRIGQQLGPAILQLRLGGARADR